MSDNQLTGTLQGMLNEEKVDASDASQLFYNQS